ncbi:RsmE family RNA methyltransferase [Ureaplasma urealyticum]|uniref:RsmE family RNA methyltransferase n=1 Tax=Ureaplasma urealyticum TaxID=2130 RepID=UPI00017940EF|nr:16S rRNA (uracil(1498)-N(3))-methyltransferase [Ureaplasma urealyticum]EEH02001.1 RNA methyltransferase, RsmE family [Ureaplasma urealyticum serovar 2 str. ATCC 27814]MDU3864774.1 16S rRNA (uracil(1498)-N(3))-methyltransferase [Ureaplasma urealyticum]
MQRYFVSKIKDKKVYFYDSDVHHIKNVMRMRLHDEIIVINETQAFIAEIINLEPLHATIIKPYFNDCELSTKIDLFQASIKPNNFEWIVQKACELGINSIYQTIFKRTYNSTLIKNNRISTIIKEACEQARRNYLVNYYEQFSFSELLKVLLNYDLILVAYENEKQFFLNDVFKENSTYQKIALVIGPEGGFEQEEIALLKKINNVACISLTKTILRSETASLYLLANLINKLI